MEYFSSKKKKSMKPTICQSKHKLREKKKFENKKIRRKRPIFISIS